MFNQLQNDIITGNMLGDGHLLKLRKETHNSYFSLTQSLAHKDYIEFIHESLQPYSLKIRHKKTRKPSFINGKINHDIKYWNGEFCNSLCFDSKSDEIFTNLRKIWYNKKNEKIVPKNIKLNWRIISIWFMDDGTNRPNHREAYLFTNNFSVDDVKFLILKLEEIGVIANLNYKSGKPIIRIPCSEYYKFIKNITEFIIPYMAYKVDLSQFKELIRRKKESYKNILNYTPRGVDDITIEKIIYDYNEQNLTQYQLSKKYNINSNKISRIIRSKRSNELNP